MTSQDPISPRARDLFERAGSRLDPDAASRLRRARHDALDGPPVRTRAMLVPAGAFTAALLALGLAWWMPPGQTVPALAAEATATPLEIEGPMIEEDPDLYAWLADAPVATGTGGRR